jgi:hypothetical protein
MNTCFNVTGGVFVGERRKAESGVRLELMAKMEEPNLHQDS